MAARFYLARRMLLEEERSRELREMRAILRESFDPLEDLPETEFRKRYRLSKDAFVFLRGELRQRTGIRSSQRVSLDLKILSALMFYASGSYQGPVGVGKNISQKSCSRFNTKYGFPGIIGCIDCTHIKIVRPRTEEEHLFFCRKNYHSINVQMICDSDYRILNVNPKFGGATHDAFIWENSLINSYMRNLQENNESVWLLGDSGYPLRPWLMTPFLNVIADSPEGIYNRKHMTARVVIENTFGRLKNRWRCLCKDRVLHYKPTKCVHILLAFMACCVLYNIALDFGVPEPEEDLGIQDAEELQYLEEGNEHGRTLPEEER